MPDDPTPDQQAELARAISALEAMADAWSAEVNLPAMIKNITSVGWLNRSAPDHVRQRFIARQEGLIHDIVCQAFIEASERAFEAGKAIQAAKQRPQLAAAPAVDAVPVPRELLERLAAEPIDYRNRPSKDTDQAEADRRELRALLGGG